MIYIVMGVSGCGKSTIGVLLANRLNLDFYDGDDFHPSINIEKMSNGVPLTDMDREPWLRSLAKHIQDWELDGGAVLACSALKQSYRDILVSTTTDKVQFIYLKGDQAILASRLRNRNAHFMPETLLKSQFDILQPPKDSVTVLLDKPAEDIVREILKEIES
ncbi:MAG: gluconokinase [Paraglaciecola sp.]|nr:gluconokinase [Paraglaciecola sp.]